METLTLLLEVVIWVFVVLLGVAVGTALLYLAGLVFGTGFWQAKRNVEREKEGEE